MNKRKYTPKISNSMSRIPTDHHDRWPLAPPSHSNVGWRIHLHHPSHPNAGPRILCQPKREVPFRQLTSTLLTSKTPDGGAFEEDCRDGLQGRRAIWDGQVCFSFYQLTNINHAPSSPNDLEVFLTHSHLPSPPALPKRVGGLHHPLPPHQLSKQTRGLFAAYPSPTNEPEGSSCTRIPSALRICVRGPCSIPLQSPIEYEGFFIADPQPSPLQMSGSFLCPFAFPLFLNFASDYFVDYTQWHMPTPSHSRV